MHVLPARTGPNAAPDVTALVRQHAVVAYFTLAFGISWGGIALLAGPLGGVARPSLLLAMLAGPATASLLLTGLLDGRVGYRDLLSRLTRWRVGARWYDSLLVSPGAILAVLGVLALFSPAFLPGVFADPLPRAAMAVAGGLVVGLCEELGWTGFVTPRLLERKGVLAAGLTLGLLWSAWHIGPDLAGTAAAWGPLWGWRVMLWMFAGMAPYRVLMTWVYRHTGSLLLGILLHAAYTGGQILLEPAAASATQQLLWWGLLDVVLLVVAGCVVTIELRDRRRPVQPEPLRSALAA